MKLGVAALIAGLSACPRQAQACKTLPPCTELAPLASSQAAVAELESKNASVAAKAAFTLARSSVRDELHALGRALQRQAKLTQILALDHGKRCVLPQILTALASNPQARARAEFIALTTSPVWAEDPNRADGADLTEALLRATSAFRPPTPEILALWQRLSLPNDGWVNVTVIALTENGSEAASKQFEALLRNPKHQLDERIAWLRSDYLAHRDDPWLLNMADRLLDGALPAKLKAAVADTTFDLHFANYSTCGPPPVPAFASFTPNARKALRAVAAKLRARRPNPRLAQAIAAALEALPKD
jgi:hypothetical protein